MRSTCASTFFLSSSVAGARLGGWNRLLPSSPFSLYSLPITSAVVLSRQAPLDFFLLLTTSTNPRVVISMVSMDLYGLYGGDHLLGAPALRLQRVVLLGHLVDDEGQQVRELPVVGPGSSMSHTPPSPQKKGRDISTDMQVSVYYC